MICFEKKNTIRMEKSNKKTKQISNKRTCIYRWSIIWCIIMLITILLAKRLYFRIIRQQDFTFVMRIINDDLYEKIYIVDFQIN